MSRCDEVMVSLERALDDGATEAPAAVRSHLDSCAACRDAWQDLRATEQLLASVAESDAPAPPAHLRARVMDAVARERRHGARRIGAEWWFAAAAALLLGVFGAARLMSPAPPDAGGPGLRSAEAPTPEQLQALAVSAQPEQVIASARQDFEWLGGAILSNARSAARMVGGAQP
jgi:hypothetical protein